MAGGAGWRDNIGVMGAAESLLPLNMRDFPWAFEPEEACLGRQMVSTQVPNMYYQLALPLDSGTPRPEADQHSSTWIQQLSSLFFSFITHGPFVRSGATWDLFHPHLLSFGIKGKT